MTVRKFYIQYVAAEPSYIGLLDYYKETDSHFETMQRDGSVQRIKKVGNYYDTLEGAHEALVEFAVRRVLAARAAHELAKEMLKYIKKLKKPAYRPIS